MISMQWIYPVHVTCIWLSSIYAYYHLVIFIVIIFYFVHEVFNLILSLF